MALSSRRLVMSIISPRGGMEVQDCSKLKLTVRLPSLLCSRLIALRQVEAPLGEGAGMSENPKFHNFCLKILCPMTKIDDKYPVFT